jgi:hypothetical protein
MADWDVFVSYTHVDQVAAGRIQAFVEDYRLPGGRKALRVFRDKTDLRAGDLGRSIPEEIGKARVLMLCCSPSAARSGWVGREVEAFHQAHGTDAPLVPLLLEGDPTLVVPETLRGRDTLILDLRGGWRLGRPHGTTRVELLRAVAAAADIPLRELIPWDVARRRRRWAVLGASAAIALAAIAITSTSAWMTRRQADAAALRRDAERATLRIEAGSCHSMRPSRSSPSRHGRGESSPPVPAESGYSTRSRESGPSTSRCHPEPKSSRCIRRPRVMHSWYSHAWRSSRTTRTRRTWRSPVRPFCCGARPPQRRPP